MHTLSNTHIFYKFLSSVPVHGCASESVRARALFSSVLFQLTIIFIENGFRFFFSSNDNHSCMQLSRENSFKRFASVQDFTVYMYAFPAISCWLIFIIFRQFHHHRLDVN